MLLFYSWVVNVPGADSVTSSNDNKAKLFLKRFVKNWYVSYMCIIDKKQKKITLKK